jgi:hypothetical protein
VVAQRNVRAARRRKSRPTFPIAIPSDDSNIRAVAERVERTCHYVVSFLPNRIGGKIQL